ncbi:MAG: hypothetical protein ABWY45_02875 [Mycobacterium sp.]
MTVFGKRYGEALLLGIGTGGVEATVYNTFGLNDCPLELWSRLTPGAVAAEHRVASALLNGPRFWLMDSIDKQHADAQEHKTFGGLEMVRQATVGLSAMNPAPYSANQVDRRAAFTFDAGREIYELFDRDGNHWVMQSYSQTVDPRLELSDLPTLGGRLALPAGWSYQARTLDAPLRIDTTTEHAVVLQDDQANSYSLLA